MPRSHRPRRRTNDRQKNPTYPSGFGIRYCCFGERSRADGLAGEKDYRGGKAEVFSAGEGGAGGKTKSPGNTAAGPRSSRYQGHQGTTSAGLSSAASEAN